jgi:hypothetical protein
LAHQANGVMTAWVFGASSQWCDDGMSVWRIKPMVWWRHECLAHQANGVMTAWVFGASAWKKNLPFRIGRLWWAAAVFWQLWAAWKSMWFSRVQ